MDNTLITQDRLESLVNLCSSTPSGAIVEIGVYKGGSLKYLSEHFPDRKVYGFDTFEGLPKEHYLATEVHNPGDFSDTSIGEVTKFIDNPKVILTKGLFPKSHKPLVGELITFVHIDTDFYLSVKACLEYFWDILPSGSIIALDDFQWNNCPGVEKALVEFDIPIQKSVNFQAYIVKP